MKGLIGKKIGMTQVWNDDSNRDGLRPASIIVKLLADGDEYKTAELNAWNRAAPVQAAVDTFKLLACGQSLCPDYEPPFHDGLHFGKKGHEAVGKALYEAEFKNCR